MLTGYAGDTPAREPSPSCRKAAEQIAREEKQVGGQLGRPSGARFRTYERLKSHAERVRVQYTLFDTEPLAKRRIDDIYRWSSPPPVRGGCAEPPVTKQGAAGLRSRTTISPHWSWKTKGRRDSSAQWAWQLMYFVLLDRAALTDINFSSRGGQRDDTFQEPRIGVGPGDQHLFDRAFHRPGVAAGIRT